MIEKWEITYGYVFDWGINNKGELGFEIFNLNFIYCMDDREMIWNWIHPIIGGILDVEIDELQTHSNYLLFQILPSHNHTLSISPFDPWSPQGCPKKKPKEPQQSLEYLCDEKVLKSVFSVKNNVRLWSIFIDC